MERGIARIAGIFGGNRKEFVKAKAKN